MITLYWSNTQRDIVSLQVQESDASYRSRGLMQRPQLVLKFSLPTYHEIPVGAYCTYQGERFTLKSPQDIKKQGTRNIEYTLTMGTDQDNMGQYKMRNSVDGRLKYSMCSTPAEFIAEIVANLNARDGVNVWSVGDCIDSAPKTIEFNHTYCDTALSMVAEEFETEWEIVSHTIHLHTVKYYDNAPLPLSYGKGNGFVPGVGRTTPVGEQPIKRLYVQGGSRNIDRSTYGSADLLLPISQTIRYDGEHFEDEQDFDSTKARTYRSSADGYYIERTDQATDSSKEDSIDCSDRYPSRIGTVSSVVEVDASKNFYDIVDSSIPNDINYGDSTVTNPPNCLIEGETLTLIFQTGMLAGKEFEAKFFYNNKRFEIVPFDYDGITMPNSTWIPALGDNYIVYGCMLPQSYICDNNAKEGASWDMFRIAVRYLYANEEQKFVFSGKLQAMWSRANWGTISPKLVVGGYIHFSDNQFAPSGTDIRIIGIKDYLTDPYAPTLDLSNGTIGQSISTTLTQISSNEVVINENYNNSINFTKRRFRDAQETIEMLQNSLLNFGDAINPITIQTMALLIGDESLQFVLLDTSTNPPTEITITDPYNESTKRLTIPACTLKHMTFGITTVMNEHSETYRQWTMSEFTSDPLTDGTKSYYLYARVIRNVNNPIGIFRLSETPIGIESVAGVYHFLVGILNSEYNGDRCFVTLYGFTEILPGRITCNRIVSNDGACFFDLVNGHIQANSAYIRGTFRSPFHDVANDYSAYNIYDNLYHSDVRGGGPEPANPVFLDWDTSQSGRRITICGSGDIMQPPTGKYLYENGVAKTTHIGFNHEIVTLVGFGDESTFYGWIVADRKQYYIPSENYNYYGRNMTALAYGRVRLTANIPLTSFRTFDNNSITATRTTTGVVTITIPLVWFGTTSSPSLDNCIVTFSSESGGGYNVGLVSKTVNNDKIDIVCSMVGYDGVAYDGAFIFMVYNASQW